MIFHASLTNAEVESLVESICGWAEEMLELGESGVHQATKLPTAAKQAFALLASESANASQKRSPKTIRKGSKL